MENNFKVVLQPSDFDVCPVWRFDEDADAYFPVRNANELPEQVRDLRIASEFITRSGQKFQGYISGVDKVSSIGLFVDAQTYHANKNLYQPSRAQMIEFIAASRLDATLTFESMFPLHFETRWENEIFKNFTGIFEMPSQ